MGTHHAEPQWLWGLGCPAFPLSCAQLLPTSWREAELTAGGPSSSEPRLVVWTSWPALTFTFRILLPHSNGSTNPLPVAGFVKSPLSQEGWAGGRVELHCQAVGSPVPEIQWWFEGNGPNDTCSQLWDGARLDRVHIHATYRQHAASSVSIEKLTMEDAGTYECRASNDPDRNHLTRAPRVKWVRAQASVAVLEREWPGCLPRAPLRATQPLAPAP